jgi:hypothetical protein
MRELEKALKCEVLKGSTGTYAYADQLSPRYFLRLEFRYSLRNHVTREPRE